jgi:hypothetical protein
MLASGAPAAPGLGPSRTPPAPDDGQGHTPCPWDVIPMAVDVRYRDKDGEISRKHGNTSDVYGDEGKAVGRVPPTALLF